MTKEPVLHIVVSVMFLALTIVLGLIPAPVARIAAMFLPVLFFVLLTSILCGPLYALFVGVLGPVLLGTIFPETPFLRALIPDVFFYATAGLVTAILYSILRTSVGSVFAGILSALITFGAVGIIVGLVTGDAYYLSEYFREALRDPLPGMALSAAVVPLLVQLFRKHGIMRVMRHERPIT